VAQFATEQWLSITGMLAQFRTEWWLSFAGHLAQPSSEYSRDSRKATMIVSQLPVANWWDLFKDSTYADACLSRMTAKAYRLECIGRDMRKTE